jgi:hypothetical protein
MRPLNGGNLDKPNAIVPPAPSAWEGKGNGWRLTVHVPSGTCFNRHNEPLTISDEFKPALKLLQRSPFQWLDCEGLSRRHGIGKGSLIVLDIIDLHETPYDQRHETVARYFPMPLNHPLWVSENGLYHFPAIVNDGRYRDVPGFLVRDFDRWPRAEWEALKHQNAQMNPASPENSFWEGLVRKTLKSKYTLQLRSDHEETTAWTKHRFV